MHPTLGEKDNFLRFEPREKRSGSLKIAKEAIHPVIKPIKGFEVEP